MAETTRRVVVRLPDEVFELIDRKQGLSGVSFEGLISSLLLEWLEGLQEGGAISDEVRAQRALGEAFMEWLPAEVCIKDSESRLLWCNSKFREMLGVDNFQRIQGKDPFHLWNPERAQQIRDLDLEVIRTGKVVCHVDSLEYPDHEPRARIGIRFPLGDQVPVERMAVLGLDLHSIEEAQVAQEAITRGWDPRIKPRE